MLMPPTHHNLERQIQDALRNAGLRVDAHARQQLARWLTALLAQPRNLTAVTDPAEAVAKHIIEPLRGFETVLNADIAVPHGPIIDIGSGNGAPGLPIALAYPNRPITLLDARAAAADFLRTLPNLLTPPQTTPNTPQTAPNAPQITVHHGRAEQAAELRGRFALALTRAAAPPRIALELAIPTLDIGGILIAYAHPPDNPAELDRTTRALGAAPIPLPNEPELIAAVKTAPTPPTYPRPWNQIRRRPIP